MEKEVAIWTILLISLIDILLTCSIHYAIAVQEKFWFNYLKMIN